MEQAARSPVTKGKNAEAVEPPATDARAAITSKSKNTSCIHCRCHEKTKLSKKSKSQPKKKFRKHRQIPESGDESSQSESSSESEESEDSASEDVSDSADSSHPKTKRKPKTGKAPGKQIKVKPGKKMGPVTIDDILGDPSSESNDLTSGSESASTDSSRGKSKRKLQRSKVRSKSFKTKPVKKTGCVKTRRTRRNTCLDSEEGSSEEETVKARPTKSKQPKKASKKARQVDEDASTEIEFEEDPNSARIRHLKAQLALQDFGRHSGNKLLNDGGITTLEQPDFGNGNNRRGELQIQVGKPTKKKRASKVAYKRVDQLWDRSIHNYKLSETVKDNDQDEWDQYIFTVRRKFDWEHKYQETFVDIKSKPLRDSLQIIMAEVKGVSLVQDTPHIDPNMLFLYLEECRGLAEKLTSESKTAKKKKARKEAATKAQHLNVIIKYLDKDYAEIKKTLYPLLENNVITFDLLWALYKPNTIAYCSTYGDSDEPRAFKIDFSSKESHFMKGSWYNVEGRYLEYDGKSFGMGSAHTDVPSFQGTRKISSLDCYPLKYHKNADALRALLLERGKKFVSLQGMNYRYHKGMAYTKRKRQILKININGRIMVDPAIHRRINPNYQISTVKPKEDQDEVEGSDEESGECGQESSSDAADDLQNTPSSSEETHKEAKKFKVIKDADGQTKLVEMDAEEVPGPAQTTGAMIDARQNVESFTEEELLIASPVVLGFAFSEKLWLEFTVSGISDVEWNDGAFDSLVLPESQKSIVKALVSSHAFHPSRSIDDIISGKGKGLVAVLHGPPGTGKTLTAEGIADLLKCPLYMVSAGDLGTDPRTLEKELQNILDIAHSWGAILLLDEADVFLEKRSIHDIHRNALVSIFLRLLEYFQGILFLTTNRVETFDEAFVSRIHLSLRYAELTTKAKKAVWKMFLEKVKTTEGSELGEITESDYNDLSRRDVNGRQIKNLVRAAQALSVHEGTALTMVHIKRVIEVAQSFERDLKGGTGYTEAMRSYT